LLAEERGIGVELTTDPYCESFRNITRLTATTSTGQRISVSGTVTGPKLVQKLTEVDGYSLEIELTDNLLIFRYEDRPGIIGQLGLALGANEVNIAGMQVSPASTSNEALSVLAVDSAVSDEVVKAVAGAVNASAFPAVARQEDWDSPSGPVHPSNHGARRGERVLRASRDQSSSTRTAAAMPMRAPAIVSVSQWTCSPVRDHIIARTQAAAGTNDQWKASLGAGMGSVSSSASASVAGVSAVCAAAACVTAACAAVGCVTAAWAARARRPLPSSAPTGRRSRWTRRAGRSDAAGSRRP